MVAQFLNSGPLILCSHLSSWLPFTPHQRACTFPCLPYAPLSPVLSSKAFTAFFSLFFLSPCQPVSKVTLGCLLVSNLSMSLAHGVSVCPAQCWGGTCVCLQGPQGPCLMYSHLL